MTTRIYCGTIATKETKMKAKYFFRQIIDDPDAGKEVVELNIPMEYSPDVYDLYDMFRRVALAFGYQPESVDEAIIQKHYEIAKDEPTD